MVTDQLPVPQQAISLIRSFESCKLSSYWDDIGKVYTIGWGCTGPDITEGIIWTQEKADSELVVRAQQAYDSVCGLVSVDINDNQASALTDFVYNLGAGALQKSTLLVLLNMEKYDQVPEQLVRWCKDKQGNVVPGLLRRRMAESYMWNEPVLIAV